MSDNRLTSAQVETMILRHIVEHMGADEGDIDVHENVLTSGLIDSVGIVRLIADLEDQLEVTVPPPDMVPENFRTIRVMADYLSLLKST